MATIYKIICVILSLDFFFFWLTQMSRTLLILYYSFEGVVSCSIYIWFLTQQRVAQFGLILLRLMAMIQELLMVMCTGRNSCREKLCHVQELPYRWEQGDDCYWNDEHCWFLHLLLPHHRYLIYSTLSLKVSHYLLIVL